jgi:hypothetical protein
MMDHQPHLDIHLLGGVHLPLHAPHFHAPQHGEQQHSVQQEGHQH